MQAPDESIWHNVTTLPDPAMPEIIAQWREILDAEFPLTDKISKPEYRANFLTRHAVWAAIAYLDEDFK